MNKIIVTGGMGYIGSHTAVDLILNGFEVVIVDSLATAGDQALDGIEKITGVRPKFYKVDICNESELEEVFEKEGKIDGVIHFAAYKYVDESVREPLKYYENNVSGQIVLLKVVKKYSVDNFVFSSSCSVYGNIDTLPVSESTPKNPAQSPYAQTKVIGEIIIEEVKNEIPTKFISLRYFNPVGAHESTFIGESPTVVPNNLVPRITGTALGKFQKLIVFGYQLPTRDGSCIRDYIHVMDLAEAHTAALKYLQSQAKRHTHEIINLGSGDGVSVLELIAEFEKISGTIVPKELSDPRPGDVVAVYSDNSKAERILGWKPKRTIKDMMITAWNWDKKNSNT